MRALYPARALAATPHLRSASQAERSTPGPDFSDRRPEGPPAGAQSALSQRPERWVNHQVMAARVNAIA